LGVWHGPPKALEDPNPASSIRTIRTLGAPGGGRSCSILGDPARIDALIREELLEIKTIYGKTDDRRTEIIAAEGEFSLEDMIAEEDMVIAITRSGYIKRLPVTTYREQRRGGIGVMGMELKDEDYIEHLFVASTHDYILFFTTVGKVYRLKVHELPLGSPNGLADMSSNDDATPLSGKPPPIPLPIVMISGLRLNWSDAHIVPVRPNPVSTSSAMSSASNSSAISRTA